MKIKYIAGFTPGLCVVAAWAQSGPASSRTADEQWTAVQTSSVARSSAAAGKKTAAQRKAEENQQALQFRSAAAAAKDFYKDHPSHINAGQARKLEALLGLQGVTDDAPAYEQTALQVARAYRNDTTNPASDRFEVAALAERVQAREKLGGKAFAHRPVELEKIADKLLAEFSGSSDAYHFYAGVARSSGMEVAARMATKLLQADAAPPEAKADAQAIRDRLALVGSTMNLRLRSARGDIVDLAQQTGKVTVVYVWHGRSGPDAMGGLLPVKGTLPADAQVMYLPLGAADEEVRAIEARKPVPGIVCTESADAGENLADRLKIQHLPFAFVLNRAGKLHGWAPAVELPTLLAAAAR